MVKSKVAPQTYFMHVKNVLEHWGDTEWLGQFSPLATPYFLGERLHGHAPTAAARGQVLQAELTMVLQTLWRGELPTTGAALLAAVAEEEETHGRGDRYDCLILELNYCKAIFRPAPKNQSAIYNDILHISRPTHDRHLAQAVERLGTLLLQRLRPAIRPEQPPAAPTLIGRDQLQSQLLAELQTGHAVSLTGPGGVGKTSLAAALTEAWSSRAIFWFTFRLSFNDQIDSLLFALGYFLHTHGASTLWHQLVADGGRVQDGNLALGLARTDLAALGAPPLLCFDELDVLRPVTPDQPTPRHVQLLEFIDSLRGYTSLLLIGQRAFWESDRLFQLDGLDERQVAQLLQDLTVPHTREDVARLHFYSGGNPRLVELCAALYRVGQTQGVPPEPFRTILDNLPTTPTLLPLWHRLARRLPAHEVQLLQRLAVFRNPAPVDAWQSAGEDRVALAQLVDRRLLLQDQQGGIALLPALREVVYGDLPVEQREQFHLAAAQLRAERGDYTAAAWQLLQAGQPAAAVALWYPQRQAEINRGQGGAALAIFAQISQNRLDKAAARTLALLRAELYELQGQPAQVVTTLALQSWPADELPSIDALLLWANALRRQGQTDGALDKYAEGLRLQCQLLDRAVQLHTLRGRAYLHQRAMPDAHREVELARFQVESLQGVYYDQRGDYDQAYAHYQAGLTIAEALDDKAAVAQIQHHLALLTGRRHGLAVAGPYYEAAMAHYQAIGDQYRAHLVRSNLANTQIQSRDFAGAVTSARTALRFFETIGDSVRTAQNASNLAEALVELDQLAEAETYAQLVLDQEEPQSHPYALYTLGTIRRNREQLAEAALYYDQARQVATMNEDNFLLAYAWEALAQVAWQQQQRDAAQHAVAQAEQLFQRLGITDKLVPLADLKAAIATAIANAS